MTKRTYKDRAQYLIRKVSERRRRLKLMSIEYKGSKCVYCGYNKCIAAMQFHHLDPSQKDFRISSGHSKSWDKVRNELDKCILLCANCHFELHDKLRGSGSSAVEQ